MLLISLDEGGHFELAAGQRSSCMMIGGAVFQGSADDVREESKRLIDLYQMVCEEQGATYPADLHYNHDRVTGKVNNSASANRVKSALTG